MCAHIDYMYFMYNQLNTSCKLQHDCDDLSTSGKVKVHQILHHLALKGHAHVAIEATSHVLGQNRLK